MKTPITYYGGKQSLTKQLLPLIPPHKIYCEPFFGGGALFFAKTPSNTEVINDVNSEVTNFFKVVKTKFSELQKEVQGTPHSRELFKKAKFIYEFPEMFSDVQRAWAFWTVTNQGFSGMTDSWGFGKDNSKERALSNKRIDFIEAYAKRLDTVQIENHDALKVIERCDSKDTFFYCDPPYLNSDQGHYAGYNESHFKSLLDTLVNIKGKFLLSSYPHALLSAYNKKHQWKTKQIKKAVWVTKLTNKQKIELIVFNYDEPKESEILNQTNGVDVNNTLQSDEHDELFFLKRFFNFNDKLIDKKTLDNFIIDLQEAILEKRIRKQSPYAKDIMDIQKAVITAYNGMTKPEHFILKPTTVKRLNHIIENLENTTNETIANADYKAITKKSKNLNLNGTENNVLPAIVSKNNAPAKVMCSTDFVNLKFNTLGFKDKWFDFIGDPSVGFTMMVFGMPKFGKSYLCIEFAGYLARHHGKVLYVAYEEKLDKTLQDKLKDKNVFHENLILSDSLPNDLSDYDFVFLDSVNKLRLRPKDLERLKADNKGVSFIYVFQATKGGQFKGNNEFQHDVDVVVEVPEIGKAVQYGRFNQGGELAIFD
jgi:DNA adenine methylase